ncbi:MAG: phosphohistidine phosphatase SixA [Anaerolineales bacterium]|nr:phosphohistidine phosphatase SixA [Anaerolineales bacterium]
MTKLYLVQHAEAQSKKQNPDRPITPRGRNDSLQAAKLLQKLGVEIDQVRHSGKTRAKQTAGIFAQHLSPEEGVVGVPGLGPVDDVRPVADEIKAGSQHLMLVGHLPFMAKIAGYLITHDPEHYVVDVKNAAVICLVKDQEAWLIDWIITPEIAEKVQTI